jgi:hypothetical protein
LRLARTAEQIADRLTGLFAPEIVTGEIDTRLAQWLTDRK